MAKALVWAIELLEAAPEAVDEGYVQELADFHVLARKVLRPYRKKLNTEG